ncbi:FtsB family cell division protein [Brevibacterium album]|uniref:FtsB family cell division protein n=1 Tax=Brevibacterium album TaxID=417948 RepID=UPI000404DB6F|nr:septum formation initiator family protein [Brevibacterium album]
MSRRSDKSRPDRGPGRRGTGARRAGSGWRPGSSITDPDAADETAAGRRLTYRSAVILGALVIVGAGLLKPIGTGLSQMQQIAALEADIEATQGEVEQLREERAKLDDPEHIERLARERMGYVREGENAYIVVGGPEADEANVTSSAGASRTTRARPWYIELADSLRAVGYAYEEER